MSDTHFSFSHIESPAPNATLPPGRHAIHGWVWPKTGGHFVDVRARLGERVFAGVHGIPRPDLAAHFKTGRATALAEFYVIVDLPAGSAELTLEVLSIDGRWLPFEKLHYVVNATLAPAHFAVPGGPLRWIDYGNGLRRLLQLAPRTPSPSLAELAATLAADLPWPRVLRDPPDPLRGFVDEPASVCCCRFGRIPAFGHLFHPQLRTKRILATVDLQSWQPLEIHRPSPGPAAFYVDFPNAQTCGFVGLVDVPAQLPNPVSLRIYAELEDGSLHLGPVVRTRLHTAEDEKLGGRTFRAFSFEETQAAWDAALDAAGITTARDADFARIVATLRAEFSPPPNAPQRAPIQTIAPLLEAPVRTSSAIPRRVILATHGLSLQGAPRFLLDLGRAFATAGSTLHVISAEDGPLRGEFASLGAKISIVETASVIHAASSVDATAAVDALARAVEWRASDLVIANSFTTFWAVHAAKAAGHPAVLFYIHESTTPAVFYGPRISAAGLQLANEAFTLADAVSFTTASTRSYHVSYGQPAQHRLTPGWVEVAALDRWIAEQNREALRAQFGLHADELLVVNIGTVSDRKGQHTFARAVDLLWRRYPEIAARTKFVLLGGRDTPFDTMLADALRELGRDNLLVHPETTDYLKYYLAADLFACSSYEESSPRVVLEAMVCGAPILASAVQGVPELVRADLEACLLPAGDTVAWCEALARHLVAPAIGRALAKRARTRVVEKFSAAVVLPRHLSLASEVASGHFTSIRAQ